jgi:hypothetical protein
MKHAFLRCALLVAGVCAFTTAMAQDDADAAALDLTVPSERIHFVSTDPDANRRNDPPGTWYGDDGGRAALENAPGAVANGDWQVHGAMEAGVGWSERAGNSNWQAANINLGKTYTDDDGDTGHVNIDINVGRGEGALFGPGYPSDYYGPFGPGPGPRMRGPAPFVR